jgi:hypothetical protein
LTRISQQDDVAGPDRLHDILELRQAEIADLEIESCFHLAIGVLKRFELAKSAMRSQAGP